MNTQEILARVNDAMAPYAVIDNAVDSRSYNAHYVASDMKTRLAALAADLEAQVRQEIAASKGVGSAVKAITAMLKTNLEHRPALAYPWIDAEGRQCVCDGYRAFRLRDHLPLGDRPEDAGKAIDLAQIFPASLEGWKELTLPSVKELRSFIALERAKWTGRRKDFYAAWSFGDHEPSVNAQYLLDAATVFPGAKLFWNTLVSPLVVTCEQGDGLLLPVRDIRKAQVPPATDAERQAIERENAENEQRRKKTQERADAILKARHEADEAWDEVLAATKAQIEACNRARDAVNAAAGDAARQAYFDACEAEAKARLRHYAATTIFDEQHSLEPNEFVTIVRKLNVRHHNAA